MYTPRRHRGGGAASADAARTPAKRWFEIRTAGVPSGYVHESLDAADRGGVRTTIESVIVMNRFNTRVEITECEMLVEERQGHLKNVPSEFRASKDTTVLDLAIGGGELTYSTRAGSRGHQGVERDSRVLLAATVAAGA